MNLTAIDVNLLVVLHTVLAEGSVTRAAARLHVTQSAVSNALARLRMTLRDPLFVRQSRRLVPTPRALALKPALAEALGQLERALRDDVFDPRVLARRWVLGVTDYAAQLIGPALLDRLRERSPGSSLRMIPVDRALRDRALDTGEASLLLGVFHTTLPGCSSAEVWRDDLVCIVRRGHPAVRRTLTLSQFTQWPHVLVSLFGGESGGIDRALAAVGGTRTVAMITPYFLASVATVATSDCIATLPRHLAERMAGPFALRMFVPPLPVEGFTMSAMWHQRTADDRAEGFFREVVRESAPAHVPRRRTRAVG